MEGIKGELITFINKLNEKHNTINKFEYKLSLQKIPFLDTTVYIAQDNNLQKTLY